MKNIADIGAPFGHRQLYREDSSSTIHAESRNGIDTREEAKLQIPSEWCASVEAATAAASSLPLVSSNVVGVDTNKSSKVEKDMQLSSTILLDRVEGDTDSTEHQAEVVLEEEIIDADVLSTRTNDHSTYSSHAGNRKFRALVHVFATEYALATKHNRVGVARKIVDNVKAAGGRFLSMDEGTNVWHTIRDKDVIEKTMFALYSEAKATMKKEDFERSMQEMPSVPVRDKDLTGSDVLCGKGFAIWPGKQKYIALIHKNIAKFARGKRVKRITMAKKVVAAVHERTGRFLEKDEASGMWNPIDFEQAVEKTHEAFSSFFHPRAASNKKEEANRPRVANGDATDFDVLTARNTSHLNGHPGNRKYQALIEAFYDEYTPAASKKAVSRKVVSAIQAKNGRFLKKDAGSACWILMADKAAVEKVDRASHHIKQRKMLPVAPSPHSRKSPSFAQESPGRLASCTQQGLKGKLSSRVL